MELLGSLKRALMSISVGHTWEPMTCPECDHSIESWDISHVDVTTDGFAAIFHKRCPACGEVIDVTIEEHSSAYL